jgi:hypothetical protein
MNPSNVRMTLAGLIGCVLLGSAFALSLADLTNQDAARGIKGALDQGATSAIAKLGVPGGFLDNPKVKTMSLDDAKRILTGGDNSVTEFFKNKTEGPLTVKFLPIVKQATDRVGLAKQYDEVAGQGAKLGLVKGDATNIDQYVTHKALDGLYLMIGEEERAIRQNPAAAGSAIVSKVFGALR